jgi:acyl carrier protein
VLAPKAAGARHLDALTQSLPLDFFLLFSSAASVLGSAGQGNYVAANAYLDGLAQRRRALGQPALSVNWGPWATSGMAAGLAAKMAARGMDAFETADAPALFDALLEASTPQLIAARVRWPLLLDGIPAVPPLLSDLAGAAQPPSESALRACLKDAAPAEARELLLSRIVEETARVMNLPVPSVERRRPLSEYGMDSLMAVELRHAIGRLAATTLPATLLFDYPTIEALGGYLWREFFGVAEVAAPETSDSAARIQGMSDQEVEALLVGKLAAWKENQSG